MTAASSCSACNGTTSKLRLIRPLLLLFAICGAADALAQSSPGKFELTPYGGYRFGGTFQDIDTEIDVELDDAASFGLIERRSQHLSFGAIHALNPEGRALGHPA